jgi:hypothetical protein
VSKKALQSAFRSRAVAVMALWAAAAVLWASPAAAEPASCEGKPLVFIQSSPMTPWRGAPLRVIVTAEKPLEAEVTLVAPDGSVAASSRQRHGGPPYFWLVETAAPAPGKWQARLTPETPGCATSRDITVRKSATDPVHAVPGSVWPIRAAWNTETEALYSAWIETLFDAPLDAAPSWKALHEVLRDRSRNFLFNYLGVREDEKGLVLKPDCADLPYFLRAYFAFKLGLPFGYSKCSRGGGGRPPTCQAWWNIEHEEPPPVPPEAAGEGAGPFGIFGKAAAKPMSKPPPTRPEGLVPSFGFYLGTTVADAVHSGSGRTAADDENTDYYPIPLKSETLRPGVVYADPYGHVLVLVRRIAQSGDAAGLLLAVDGQPDGTVARKRFWRGNFLFAQDPALGGPGFKRFRPVVAVRGGGLRRLRNAEIAANPQYADFALDQARLGVEAFYDRMDDVLSPAPLDPTRAMLTAIDALEEQVKARVTSVENGRKFLAGGGAVVAMPEGASIFETTGAWEDFATPSRDLRLLIAIDVVTGFPERVARRPERYAMPSDKAAADVKAELTGRLDAELASRKVAYTRSDGSSFTLALKDVAARGAALEMAYNVNDCAELRWGAADGSEEAQPCRRRASSEQRRRMENYRVWFHERRRPPRGLADAG